jgi:hypothetical protein
MKVTVEVDCTPSRQLTPEALLKAWMPMASDQMQQAFAKLFSAFGGSRPGDRG